MDYVTPRRVDAALAVVEGFPFERFVNDFMSALLGAEFVPLGGVKDGGADGLLADGKGRFLQTSVRDDVKAKIRQTVLRLKEFGRSPRQVIYVSSKEVRFPDTIEDELTDELDVTIRIRDANYIRSHINDSSGTVAAYFNHLQALTLDLDHTARGALVSRSSHVRDPSVFVFLSQEADDRGGSQSLLNDVVDSLIFWALEGTDPEKNILMSQEQILKRIVAELPTVNALVRPRLPKRLAALSSKGGGTHKRVRFYKAEMEYCLPFETRTSLADEIAEDLELRHEVETSLQNRAEMINSETSDADDRLTDDELARSVIVGIRALQLTFERQGITFMSALTPAFDSAGGSGEESGEGDRSAVYIADHLAEALDEQSVDGRSRIRIGEVTLQVLRGVIFGSNESERAYLRKLSKTFTLLFTLNLEPKLLSYFQQMTGAFYLYVGSDQIVRALSESFLEPEDRVITNTLKMAAAAGARLILTEPALNEAWRNLETSDWEYQNTFALVNDAAPYDIVRNSPKILVRAYMYARMGEGKRKPSSWQAFVNQFCNYADLHKPTAFDSIRRYLQAEYGFEFRTTTELEALVDSTAHDALTRLLMERSSKIEVLARHDALLALAVYGRRRRAHESSNISEFGFNTWWLTHESQILRHTRSLVESHHGTGYIMRPEFLLNFLTLAPSAGAAREAYKNVFPSLLGVNLSRRMPEKGFRAMLDRITSAEDLSEARRSAEISKLADKMKGDFSRNYLSTHSKGESLTGVDAVFDRSLTVEVEEQWGPTPGRSWAGSPVETIENQPSPTSTTSAE